VRQCKIDLIHEELELFVMMEDEIVSQMYDRLMILVSDIRALRSNDWEDSKVTKKLLKGFTPVDTFYL
jgi:hypothetical protein